MSTFTELSDEIIILIAKCDVTPLAIIIASKKIYNLLNKKQLRTKKTRTMTNYIFLEKMVIKDSNYVVMESIKKSILKLKPRNIYVYWFTKVNNRQCGCKYKDVYKFDKGNIINERSDKLIECNTHKYIYNKPNIDVAIISIMERNMVPVYRRHANYSLEY